MPKTSAGIILYKFLNSGLQVFLVHPGGPFYKKKDHGHWSIPKGEFMDDEDALTAARREFEEETGQPVDGKFIPLNPVQLKSGKIIYAWAVEGDINHELIEGNLFEIEWPPGSGRVASFPEVDRAGWFSPEEAALKLNPAQADFISQLTALLN